MAEPRPYRTQPQAGDSESTATYNVLAYDISLGHVKGWCVLGTRCDTLSCVSDGGSHR